MKEDQCLHIKKNKDNDVQKVYDNIVVNGKKKSEKGQISKNYKKELTLKTHEGIEEKATSIDGA